VGDANGVIYRLCSWRPLSSSELAFLLGRNTKHLTDAYLYPLVKDGILRYLHPEMVNHPQQKYVAGRDPDKTKAEADPKSG
jgi:ATP-dependent DNA helicase RecG